MSNQQRKPLLECFIEVVVHVLTWCYIFLSPLIFKHSGESINWDHYLHGSILPLTICVAFYLNYFVLIPRFLLTKGKQKWFFIVNIIIFALYQTGVECQSIWFPPHPPKLKRIPEFPMFPPKSYFVIRGLLFYIFSVGASVALKLSLRWRQSEQARAEAELGRSQAELKNLKNQINPHFLLNTLNNIYALTAFDQVKAQQAIQELSRLLRYMLYENQSDRVSLDKEVEFLKSYIALMRLRLYNDVEVKAEFDYPESQNVPIAPLIFISLVENAFKHGVCSTGNSFIHISLKANAHHLVFKCENSNTPKNESDKAPGGIGLKQVASRLQFAYLGRYKWKYGAIDGGKTYSSVIEIFDKPIEKS